MKSNRTTFTCAGGFVTLSTGSYATYLWSTGETTQSINVSVSGTYNLTVTQGTCIGNASKTVTIGTSPVPVVTANGPTTFCQGSSVTLSAFAGGGATYAWSNNAVGESSGVITASGTYCVTATNVLGCTGSACMNIIVNNFITPTITGNIPNPCTASTVSLNAGSGYSTYSWSDGEVTQLINGTGGNYSVTVTNANGCSGNASFSLASFCPKVSPTMTGTPSFSACGSITLGTILPWFLMHGAMELPLLLIPLQQAEHTLLRFLMHVVVRTSSHSAQILVAPSSNLTATGLATYCSGSGNVTLAASAGFSYVWSTGATTSSISIAPGNPGTYCVTISNSTGCSTVACDNISSSASSYRHERFYYFLHSYRKILNVESAFLCKWLYYYRNRF